MQKTFAIFLFLCIYSNCYCQRSPVDTIGTNTSTTKKGSSFTSIFYGQPGKAALYSLIIPGAGQIYNRRYWKFPIVVAGEGYAVYYLSQRIKKFKSIDQCWRSYVDTPDTPHPSCTLENGTVVGDRAESFDRREVARSNKEAAWLILSAVHLLNVVEAFVDRHLINFDTSEDLSFHNLPKNEIANHSFSVPTLTLITVRIPLSTANP